MKENELRKGNHLLLDEEKKYEVIWVKYEKVCLLPLTKEQYPSCIVNIDRCSGEFLNDQKLTELGFEYNSDGKYCKHGITISRIKDSFIEEYEFIFNGSCIILNYVHQLQNLYYVLVGVELI